MAVKKSSFFGHLQSLIPYFWKFKDDYFVAKSFNIKQVLNKKKIQCKWYVYNVSGMKQRERFRKSCLG